MSNTQDDGKTKKKRDASKRTRSSERKHTANGKLHTKEKRRRKERFADMILVYEGEAKDREKERSK